MRFPTTIRTVKFFMAELLAVKETSVNALRAEKAVTFVASCCDFRQLSGQLIRLVKANNILVWKSSAKKFPNCPSWMVGGKE